MVDALLLGRIMVVEIKINYKLCIGCKACVKVCSFGVLEWFEDAPVVVNPNNCAGCMECKKNCPVGAIEIKEK